MREIIVIDHTVSDRELWEHVHRGQQELLGLIDRVLENQVTAQDTLNAFAADITEAVGVVGDRISELVQDEANSNVDFGPLQAALQPLVALAHPDNTPQVGDDGSETPPAAAAPPASDDGSTAVAASTTADGDVTSAPTS